MTDRQPPHSQVNQAADDGMTPGDKDAPPGPSNKDASADDAEKDSSFNVDTEAVDDSPITPQDDRRVQRKVDRVVMTLAAAVYFMQYLDKRGLAFAAIFGMREELGLVGQEYSWAVSLFSFGTLTMMMLSPKILHLVSVRVYVGTTVLIWGGVMMAQAAPKDATGLLIGRYFLGLAEGSAYPAAIVLISIWYRKAEHAARFASLYIADIIAQGFGGMMLFGFSSIQGSISGWRIAMIIAGCMTIVVGSLFAWLIPNKIETAWFLSPEDRVIAVKRVAAEHASAEMKVWDWGQFWETVKDPRLYICFLWAFIIVACTVLNFGTLILNGLGFSPFITTVLQLPPCAMQTVVILVAIALTRFYPNKRSLVQGAFAIVPLLGAALLQVFPFEDKWSLAGALWLSSCNHPLIVINLSMLSSNIKGHTRKTIFSSVYYAGYAVGNIAGPQMYLNGESPLYPTAMRSICGMYAGYMLLVALFALLNLRENRRRDRMAAEGNEAAIAKPAAAFDNTSDLKDLSFRYCM